MQNKNIGENFITLRDGRKLKLPPVSDTEDIPDSQKTRVKSKPLEEQASSLNLRINSEETYNRTPDTMETRRPKELDPSKYPLPAGADDDFEIIDSIHSGSSSVDGSLGASNCTNSIEDVSILDEIDKKTKDKVVHSATILIESNPWRVFIANKNLYRFRPDGICVKRICFEDCELYKVSGSWRNVDSIVSLVTESFKAHHAHVNENIVRYSSISQGTDPQLGSNIQEQKGEIYFDKKEEFNMPTQGSFPRPSTQTHNYSSSQNSVIVQNDRSHRTSTDISRSPDSSTSPSTGRRFQTQSQFNKPVESKSLGSTDFSQSPDSSTSLSTDRRFQTQSQFNKPVESKSLGSTDFSRSSKKPSNMSTDGEQKDDCDPSLQEDTGRALGLDLNENSAGKLTRSQTAYGVSADSKYMERPTENESSKTQIKKKTPSKRKNRTFHNLAEKTPVFSLKTDEGLNFCVYKENILHMRNIDCIINFRQEDRSITNSVDQALRDELKQTYTEASTASYRKPGWCIVTGAGQLPYKKVLHVWLPYCSLINTKSEIENCIKHLQSSVSACLVEASKNEMTSVALSAIGTGYHGYPVDKWIDAVLEVIEQYYKVQNERPVTSINFVDLNKDVTDQITAGLQRKFCQDIPGEKCSPEYENHQLTVSLSPSLKVHVYTVSIAGFKGDAIGVPVDSFIDHLPRLMEVIENAGGPRYKSEIKKLFDEFKRISTGEVISTDVVGDLSCKKVFYVKRGYSHDIASIETAMNAFLNKAVEMEAKTLALPIIINYPAKDFNGIVERMSTFVKALQDFASSKSSRTLSDIYIMDTDQIRISALCSELKRCEMIRVPSNQSADAEHGASMRESPVLEGSGGQAAAVDSSATKEEQEDNHCSICFEEINTKKVLPCGHKFHLLCIDKWFAEGKKSCPLCQRVCATITGNQPDGQMQATYIPSACHGYERWGTIVIDYFFPNGTQNKHHPNPGKPYKGATRYAYLPNNEKGQRVLKLLRKAFDQRLIFTVGQSVTTGNENVVTWNGIHHKTSMHNPERFGYPDPTYLDRVLEELKAVGITDDDDRGHRGTPV